MYLAEIYNSSGQLVQVAKSNAAKYIINLCPLTNGLFIVKVKDDNNNWLIDKFIKL